MHLLHLEDSTPDAELIADQIRGEWKDCVIERVDCRAAFVAALENPRFDLILSDYSIPGFDGLSALEMAHAIVPEIPFIFISGTIGEERAVEALKRGASDYVIKDRPRRLTIAIRQAIERAVGESRRRRLEAEIRQAQRLESIGMLCGGIAHDMNNVLTPIIIGTSLLQSEAANESTRQIILGMEASAEHGAALVRQLLAFARGAEGQKIRMELPPALLTLQKLLRQSMPDSIKLIIDSDPAAWPVSADPTQFQQLLVNLCLNARDAMPGGGTIRIRTRNVELEKVVVSSLFDAKPGRFLSVEVIDEGSGIPPAIIEKIFDPFFTTKSATKGTGLGLANVVAILKSHQGFVTVESELGKGTTFHLYLPAFIEPAGSLSIAGGSGGARIPIAILA